MKEFLKRKNIEISLKRYGIDAMGAMAQGLFCSLLIGTIIDTVGKQFGIPFLTQTVATLNAGGNTIDYTVGETTFKAEKYPAQSEYGVDQIFCFDETGSLAYMINCANDTIGLGEYIYKIDVIDDAVDESLFDITGYEFVDYQTALAEAQAALEQLAG